MIKWHFWVDNGEEKDPTELLKPELELEDDSNLDMRSMSTWAADELDLGDDSSIGFIVHRVGTEVWHLVSLYRNGWSVSSCDLTTPVEITGGC